MPSQSVTKIKTTRPVKCSDLVTALSKSMEPMFQHLENCLAKRDGRRLSIDVEVKGADVKVQWGVSDI